MSANRKGIIAVVNRSSGELDWIMPILVWLALNKYDVSLMFLRKREYSYLENSGALLQKSNELFIGVHCFEAWLDELSLVRLLLIRAQDYFYRILNVLLNLISTGYETNPGVRSSFRTFLRSEVGNTQFNTLFFDNSFYKDLSRKKSQDLQRIVMGEISAERIFIYPHMPVLDVAEENGNSSKALLSGSWRESVPKDNFYWKQFPKDAKHSILLTGTTTDAINYHRSRGLGVLDVGCPRFQKWWYGMQKTASVDRCTINRVLILSKSGGGLFKKNQQISPLILLEEIALTCEKAHMDWLIKMHPRDDIESINQLVRKISSKSPATVTTQGALIDVAENIDFCVAIPSSAILDAVSSGIPCVEYFRPNKESSSTAHKSQYIDSGMAIGCANPDQLSLLLSKMVADEEGFRKIATDQQLAFEKYFATSQHAGKIVQGIIDSA